MEYDQMQRLMGFVNSIHGFASPDELREIAEDRERVEQIVQTTLSDEDWEFVRTELCGIVEVDPLCGGVPLDSSFYNDDDA